MEEFYKFDGKPVNITFLPSIDSYERRIHRVTYKYRDAFMNDAPYCPNRNLHIAQEITQRFVEDLQMKGVSNVSITFDIDRWPEL